MANKKGFTLIELIVVLVIVGILATIAVPTYFNIIQQQTIIAVEYNLRLIANAQNTYFLNNGTYYNGSNLPDLNTNLHLNINDYSNTYFCTTDGAYCNCEVTDGAQHTWALSQSAPLKPVVISCQNFQPGGPPGPPEPSYCPPEN